MTDESPLLYVTIMRQFKSKLLSSAYMWCLCIMKLKATIQVSQVKAIEQYFHVNVVLFIILFKVFLTFKLVDKILERDLSSKSYLVFNF